MLPQGSDYRTTCILTRSAVDIKDSPITNKLTIFDEDSELKKSRSFHCDELEKTTTRLSVWGPKILRAITGSDRNRIKLLQLLSM